MLSQVTANFGLHYGIVSEQTGILSHETEQAMCSGSTSSAL